MPGAWDKIKTAAKEVGEKVIGRGPEVKYRHEAQDYSDKNGVSIEIAQKTILARYFDAVERKAAVTRAIDYDSSEWRAVAAAVKETMGDKGIDGLKKTADDPRYPCRPVVLSPAEFKRSYSAQEGYYKSKYEKRAPDYAVLKDCAENAAMFANYSKDFRSFVSSFSGNAASLEALLARNPKMKAEFGRLFQLKGLAEKHEDRFKKDMNFEKTWNASKVELQKSVKEMLTGTGNYCVNVVKACQMMFQGNFGAGLMKGLGETAKFLGIETWGAIKVAYHGGKVLGSKVKNL